MRWISTRVRSTWRRNSWPRPTPLCAPSMRPGRSARTKTRSPPLWTTVLGFLIAIAGGMLLGVLIGASPLIYSGLYPLLIAFNAVPKVAIVPILMIWVGVDGFSTAAGGRALGICKAGGGGGRSFNTGWRPR